MKTIPNLEIPSQMKALVLPKYNTKLQVQEKQVPIPGKGEVLVEIDSSPINPSDLSFIKGNYSTKKALPVVAGFEGSGRVVATGSDFMSRRLLGKSVACFAPTEGNGTWSEYMVTKNRLVIPLKSNMDIEQGAMLMVNPLSVLAMLDIAKKGGHKAIANTAAASTLGKMLNSLCLNRNIPIINIVRREDQAELLKNQGAKYVINSSSDNYADEMKSMFHELKVTLAFDAVAGSLTSDLIGAMPSGGEVMVYGGLSEQPISIHPRRLIFEKKKLSGFWASEWITHQPMLKLLGMFNKIQKHLSKSHQISIQKRISLEEGPEGLLLYQQNMSSGKVLVKPGMG